jgi:hypothetical protein
MISSFAKWLAARKKKGQPSISPPKTQVSEPERDKGLDPDELERAWKDSQSADPRTGMTDSDREYWSKNNRTTNLDPDDLERAWRRSQS